jgi:hypothetical protein
MRKTTAYSAAAVSSKIRNCLGLLVRLVALLVAVARTQGCAGMDTRMVISAGRRAGLDGAGQAVSTLQAGGQGFESP